MAEFDWGESEPPHPYAPESDGTLSPAVDAELPEVVRLGADGFELAPDAPFLAFLPAVWPRGRRTWIPDRSTRYVEQYSSAGHSARVSWSAKDHAEVWGDRVELLREAGVPEPQKDRLWLLQVPPEFGSLDDFVKRLVGRAEDTGVEVSCNRDFVEFTRRFVADAW